MRIEKPVVEEEVSTDEDIILAVDNVVFKKDVKCGNIVSEGYKRNITGKNINCGDINCGNINCGNINCGDIDCLNIDCLNIDCLNIDCGDIDCLDIDCLDIDCRDINCWDINCGDIDCLDIEAGFVVCESRKKKNLKAKTVCYNLIIGRSKYEKKEAMK